MGRDSTPIVLCTSTLFAAPSKLNVLLVHRQMKVVQLDVDDLAFHFCTKDAAKSVSPQQHKGQCQS